MISKTERFPRFAETAPRMTRMDLAVLPCFPITFPKSSLATDDDLLESIDQIRCRDDVLHPKPSPDPYLAVLDALGVAPGQAIAFEDSPAGVAAAKAAGVFCVAVPNTVTRGLAFPGVDLVVSSLAEVSLEELIVIRG